MGIRCTFFTGKQKSNNWESSVETAYSSEINEAVMRKSFFSSTQKGLTSSTGNNVDKGDVAKPKRKKFNLY